MVLDGLPAAGNHNGGRIAFGPDGMLYAGAGDAAQGDRAQDLDSLGGKILRMTPDGGIPDDNPFAGSLVYSYGHRNVQGLAWTEDGTMFATEFGQDTWDELNIIEAGGNYGWPIVEGQGGGDEFIDPVQQWRPDAASPSGMAIIGGTIFIANLRGEVLRRYRRRTRRRQPTTTCASSAGSGMSRPARRATCGSSPATRTAEAVPARTTTGFCGSSSALQPRDESGTIGSTTRRRSSSTSESSKPASRRTATMPPRSPSRRRTIASMASRCTEQRAHLAAARPRRPEERIGLTHEVTDRGAHPRHDAGHRDRDRA